MREFLTKVLDYMISMFFKLTFKQIKNFHYWLGSVAPMDPPCAGHLLGLLGDQGGRVLLVTPLDVSDS